jgi:hypothetical protein
LLERPFDCQVAALPCIIAQLYRTREAALDWHIE